MENKYRLETWIRDDLLPDDRVVEKESLLVITGPCCEGELKTKSMELKVKVGGGDLTEEADARLTKAQRRALKKQKGQKEEDGKCPGLSVGKK